MAKDLTKIGEDTEVGLDIDGDGKVNNWRQFETFIVKDGKIERWSGSGQDIVEETE